MKNRHWHFPHYDINLHLDSHGIARWHNSCWCYSMLLCNCHWFLLNCRIWYGFRDINDQFASHLIRIITCKSASLILADVNKKGYSEHFHGLQHMFRHLQRICGFFQILNIHLRTFKKSVPFLYKRKLQPKFFPEAVIFSFNFDIIGNIKWHQVKLKRTRHKVTFGLISTLLRSSNCINSNRFMNTKKISMEITLNGNDLQKRLRRAVFFF